MRDNTDGLDEVNLVRRPLPSRQFLVMPSEKASPCRLANTSGVRAHTTKSAVRTILRLTAFALPQAQGKSLD